MYSRSTLLSTAGFVWGCLLLRRTWRFLTFHLNFAGDVQLLKYQRPRSWALVTGSSAGIGLGFAKELVLRGFNVILLGHLPGELQSAETMLRQLPGAKEILTVTLDARTSTPAEIETALEPVTKLPLTILINNVGGITFKPYYQKLEDHTAGQIDDMINLNARFAAHVTRVLVPTLKLHGPSAILNVSSGSCRGMPWMSLYSSVKAFNAAFGRALAREFIAEGSKIDSLVVCPGDVQSQANTRALAPGSPTAETFAKAVLDRVVTAVRQGRVEIMPYWAHDLQLSLFEALPEFLAQRLTVTSISSKIEAERAQNSKSL
ncbi:NAD(P)-binding protein [Aaosphaeria arxii CBS 175.79]|uniref:NAD(P)-binding protein n=1 Tax=Aaosphaeria arxii CBS 175.79 TaxID=1450172 RepID=A0A6A5XGR7_9PLEO|nr:NAD(P)-binding protein [Aaosphaeria arxii CBS 175.79]KAF2011991.1 NAD(P)-binding protein [Aaosphaeria arxii CBS 175.79]